MEGAPLSPTSLDAESLHSPPWSAQAQHMEEHIEKYIHSLWDFVCVHLCVSARDKEDILCLSETVSKAENKRSVTIQLFLHS